MMKKLFLALMLALSFTVTFVAGEAPAAAQYTPPPPGAPPPGTPPPEGSGWYNPFGWGEDGDDDPKAELSAWQEAFSAPNYCWGCQLYASMSRVVMTMGQKGEQIFAPGATSALSAFMGLWVTWQLYLLLSPTHANGPAQTIDTIFQRIVLMIIILWILNAGAFQTIMVDYAFPAINGTMSAATALIPGGGGGCSVSGGSDLATEGVGLICAMHVQMGQGMGLGAFLMDTAEFALLTGEFQIFQFLGGLLLFLAFAWSMIMMPFRLFDAMIRIAVVAVILPVAVLAYQFKPTRGFTKQAATSVLAAGLTFLFTAVAVAIAVTLLQEVAGNALTGTYAEEELGWFGPISPDKYMVLLATAAGLSAFIKSAGSIASEFAGFQGSMGNVGGGGAAVVAGAAATTAMVATYGAAKGAGAAAGGAGKIGSAIMSPRGGGGGGGSSDAGTASGDR